MPADYKAMYLELVHAASDAVSALDHGGGALADQACQLLRNGLLAAEEIYLQTKDARNDD